MWPPDMLRLCLQQYIWSIALSDVQNSLTDLGNVFQTSVRQVTASHIVIRAPAYTDVSLVDKNLRQHLITSCKSSTLLLLTHIALLIPAGLVFCLVIVPIILVRIAGSFLRKLCHCLTSINGPLLLLLKGTPMAEKIILVLDRWLSIGSFSTNYIPIYTIRGGLWLCLI